MPDDEQANDGPHPAQSRRNSAEQRGYLSMQERLRRLRDEIKGRIDYRSFYLRYCPDARQQQSASRLQSHCPIPSHAHSGKGHPSLSIDLQQGLFNCFSRAEGGDAITFYELMHGVTFAQALREMSAELGLTGEHRQQRPSLALSAAPDTEARDVETFELLGTERMRAVCEKFLEVCRIEDQLEGINYLARRGIDAATMRRAGVTYFPRRAYRRVMRRMLDHFASEELQRSGLFNRKSHLTFYLHRLLFPFLVEGRALYLQGRTTAAGVELRWHNMRGAVPALYNIDVLARTPSNSVVYLVEGFTDTLTLMTHGFHAVGIAGAGGLREDWITALARFRVVAALDPDDAGRRAVARYAKMFARRGLKLSSITLSADVNDFFRQRPSASLEFQLLTETELENDECGMMNDE